MDLLTKILIGYLAADWIWIMIRIGKPRKPLTGAEGIETTLVLFAVIYVLAASLR